ncbi:probable transcription factor At3g04930 [Lolium rigidum]|uniref:probable transcription factor At3g04930 n=1 Tax=Lolium rigidum TaxID=89674 RepID=UPI001F5DBBC3|nr:probable transcription factor At3g04930 [Lolium rigidum]
MADDPASAAASRSRSRSCSSDEDEEDTDSDASNNSNPAAAQDPPPLVPDSSAPPPVPAAAPEPAGPITPPPSQAQEESAAAEDSRRLFQRLWTDEEELLILRGFLEFTSRRGTAFASHQYDTGPFYEEVRRELSFDFSKNQLIEKLRRLKKKYRVCAKRMLAQGGTFAFRSAHEGAIYDVARHIWRPAFKPDGSDDDDINPAEADEGGGGNTPAHAPRGRGSRRGRRRTAQEMETPSMPATPAAPILVTDSIAQEQAVVALENSVPPIAPPPPVTANGPTEDDFRSILSPLLKELISSVTVAGQTELGSGLGMGFGRVSGTDILGLRFGVAGLNPVAPSGDKWKQQQILELEVYLKRIELVREQVTTVLQELRSSEG